VTASIYRPAAGPTDRRAPYRFSAFMRVGFDETDAQGVVYYGRYFPYFDRSRVEYLRFLGLLGSLPAGLEFVMRHSACDYQAPARFDDLLEVFIRTARIGTSSLRFDLEVHDAENELLLARAEQAVVLIDVAERRPRPVPPAYRHVIERFEGTA
jgi:tol-pal system-associated acyl-CoA thioesterase